MISENLEKETKLLEYIKSLPHEEIKGEPERVLEEMDKFGAGKYKFMHVGASKGKIIIEQMNMTQPKLMVELGGYVGYSAILFGNELKKNLGKFYSLEVNEDIAKIAGELIDIAGLSDYVEIMVGPAAKSIEKLATKYRSVDFIFIDHCKDLYLPDLRVLETMDLIVPGTVITADNVIIPGAPEYLKYVNGSPEEKRQYNNDVENVNGKIFQGKWNLLYNSYMVKALTPRGDEDGVEITECVEYLY